MTGWCPKCGRKLHDLMVNGRGSCRQHGVVPAEWEDPTMVVDTLKDEVLGFRVGVDIETGDISYRSFDGETRYVMGELVEVLKSSEISQGEW